ncbi:4'-phosphopantetheinyl transferase family protein [Neptuniibacter sp. QD72_48]|uniref:4'-phosphopantetheinyl transferase family protein n=1 Tax=unclassified Neptuniibacter TaxID=2630693 RepID=UPI0039F67E0F
MLISPPLYRSSFPISCSERYKRQLLETGLKLPPSISDSSLTRQCEYLAGRFCAIESLTSAGFSAPIEITIGTHGSPIWPQGFIGSISHCEDLAAAVVMPKTSNNSAIGLDIEKVMAAELAQGVEGRILFGKDRNYQSAFDSFEQFLTILFSAKEALYKAIYPQAKKVLGFESAQLEAVYPEENRITLSLTTSINKHLPQDHLFSVEYRYINHDTVETLVIVE